MLDHPGERGPARPLGKIHAAGLDSPRLQRVLSILRQNRTRWLSRRELRELCGPEIEDPTVCLREAKARGVRYECTRVGGQWRYRLAADLQATPRDDQGNLLLGGIA